MKAYAQKISDDSYTVNVGLGENKDFYKSIGMTEMEVEQGYDGAWYVKGHAPTKPIEVMQEEVRSVRNQYLLDTDKYVTIPDYPISESTKSQYITYRQYLRDYPSTDNWYESNPKTFEEYIGA